MCTSPSSTSSCGHLLVRRKYLRMRVWVQVLITDKASLGLATKIKWLSKLSSWYQNCWTPRDSPHHWLPCSNCWEKLCQMTSHNKCPLPRDSTWEWSCDAYRGYRRPCTLRHQTLSEHLMCWLRCRRCSLDTLQSCLEKTCLVWQILISSIGLWKMFLISLLNCSLIK